MTERLGCIVAQTAGDVLVLTITQNRVSSLESADVLGRELAGAVQNLTAPSVVVDLVNVQYMSSVGYGPLINLRSRIREAGGRMILCGLSPLLKEMFDATRLLINPRSPKSLFEFTDTRDNAVALFRGSAN